MTAPDAVSQLMRLSCKRPALRSKPYSNREKAEVGPLQVCTGAKKRSHIFSPRLFRVFRRLIDGKREFVCLALAPLTHALTVAATGPLAVHHQLVCARDPDDGPGRSDSHEGAAQ